MRPDRDAPTEICAVGQLWQRRHHATAVIAIFIAFMAYYLVLLYHVQYAATLVRSLFQLT